MKKDSQFWNKTANKYAKQSVADQPSYEHKLQKTQEYLTSNMDVLEVGCGTGSTAIIHAPLVRTYHAIDFSSEMINIATKKSRNIDNLSFTTTTIEQIASTAKYHAVLALNVLHLMDNRDDTIHQVHEILEEGGYFITSTVCLGERMMFMKLLAPIGRFFGLMPRLRIFNYQELRASLINKGFTIEYSWTPPENKYGIIFIVAKK